MLLETDVDVWLLRSDGATNASAALQHDIARAERNGKVVLISILSTGYMGLLIRTSNKWLCTYPFEMCCRPLQVVLY